LAWILHVSDAHLGQPAAHQFLDDNKARLLRPSDRLTTQMVLRNSLSALASWTAMDKFDAVVFSGDVTNFAREDGYQAFDGLMAELGSHCPSEDRIVVVPGNHDVKWGTPPGSDERYELFKQYIRGRGYVSPLLDGIDLDHDGGRKPTAGSPVLEHPEFVVLAMNSSNYCGISESTAADGVNWNRALRLAGPKTRRLAKAELDKIRQHDVARVSSQQLRGIHTHLAATHLIAPLDERLRIAVLHHHLLPVSTREEVKTFESVTNLAEVRLFLRDLGFHVVLHGHKHESAVYWDYVNDPSDSLATPSARMLVMSAPGHFRPGELTCRVLEILPRAPHPRGPRSTAPSAPMIRVYSIPGCRRGEGISGPATEIAPLWRSAMEAAPTPFDYVYGGTVDEVYERLQSLYYERGDEPVRDLICVVDSPASRGAVPAGFPPTGEADENDWFESLVRWWQLKESRIIGHSKLLPFNHGQRIYGWGEDAIGRAAQTLAHDPTTTRSIVVLVDPRTEAGREDAEYPAFVLVQLRLVRRERGLMLDAVGYFRKQDVRHWWAVNVAELIKLQREALKKVNENGTTAQQGRIVTFASTALVDEVLPALAVTTVDRTLDENPNELWRLAYFAAHPDAALDASEALQRWERLLADLKTTDEGGQVRVATVGLQELAGHMQLLHEVHPTAVQAVYEPLRALAAAHKVLSEPQSEEVRQEQAELAGGALESLLGELRSRLGSPTE